MKFTVLVGLTGNANQAMVQQQLPPGFGTVGFNCAPKESE
jgi:hypothetical protein